MKKMKCTMTSQIMIAVAAGIIAGVIFGDKISQIKLIGDIFLRLIRMAVVVMIMGAVIEAVGNLEPQELGKLGIKILFWFTITTVIAAAVGIGFGWLLKPGQGVELVQAAQVTAPESESLSEIILDFFPVNIVQSMADSNMIQAIVFSILFGVALSTVCKEKAGYKVMEIIAGFNTVLMQMVKQVMKFAPLGIGSLVAYTIGTAGIRVMLPLIKFLGVFALGTGVHLIICIVATGVYCKTNPMQLAKKLTEMTLVAFTTTSSAVALPVKMKDSEEKLGVSKRISGLVNPLGMTLNSNGLSMFLALACITIGQIYGVELSFPMLAKVVVLSSLACLGTVVVPGGGIVALTILIPGLGFPTESIALLASIDWFSGMFRTVLNVDIDALVAVLIAKDAGELDYRILNNKG